MMNIDWDSITGPEDLTYKQFMSQFCLREYFYDFTQHPLYFEYIDFFLNAMKAWGHEGKDVEAFAINLAEHFMMQQDSLRDRPENLDFCSLMELYLEAYYDFEKEHPNAKI